MDVRFTRQDQGNLVREVYQKPTHTNRYVQFDSHQPNNVKAGVVQCLVNRAVTVCSSVALRDAELKNIRQAMTSNGYPKKFTEKAISKQLKKATNTSSRVELDQPKLITTSIPFIDGLSQEVRRIARTAGIRCAFSTPSTLSALYSVKDTLPKDTRTHAVYSLQCNTCKEEYIGETLRAVGVRRKEHCDAIRLGQFQKSAVAEHVHNKATPHEIDWSSLQVIDTAFRQTERKIREAMHIHKRKPALNRDQGIERSTVWNAVL